MQSPKSLFAEHELKSIIGLAALPPKIHSEKKDHSLIKMSSVIYFSI